MKFVSSRPTWSRCLSDWVLVITILGAGMLGFAQPAAAPRPTQVQYAVLTKVGGDQTLPCRQLGFDFADRNNHYAGENLRQLLKSRLPVAEMMPQLSMPSVIWAGN